MKTKRKKKVLSVRHLSEIIGVSFATISRLERGVSNPSPPVMARIETWVNTDQGTPKQEKESKKISLTLRVSHLEQKVHDLEELLKK